ncbi:Uncharacterized protein (Fragment) [Durusdinium trenchii]|uniref:Uncharacterized protein n=1 Tax=Durusdinium trenchii TaxID=1381693 RepID=A0ABP0H763_9DINO
MQSKGQKSSTSSSLLKALTKTLLDGPLPEEIPFKKTEGIPTYEMTQFVVQVQKVYRKEYGTARARKVPAEQDDRLPRREQGLRKGRKTGMAAFLREREGQIQRSDSSKSESPQSLDSNTASSLSAVKEAACSNGKKRQEYESYAAALENIASKKRKVLQSFGEKSDPEAKQKLKAAEEKIWNKPTLERRDLAINLERGLLLVEALCLVVLRPGVRLSGGCRNAFEPLKLKVVAWTPNDGSFLQEVSSVKHVIWFDSTPESLDQMIHLDNKADQDDYILGTRMYGGFVAGIEWLDHCVKHKLVIRPVLCLKSALTLKQELVIHKSLRQKTTKKNSWCVVGKEQLKKLKEEHVEKKHLGYVIDFLNFIFRCTL